MSGSVGEKQKILHVLVDWSGDFSVFVDFWAMATIFVVIMLLVFVQFGRIYRRGKRFEISEAELGVGNQKFTLKPNDIDRQIAYKIWVELSTRKIGLDIDLENDVISEVYDSWYTFFGVTRELVKEIPAHRMQDESTEAIVNLSIDILNEGIRPHLTKWQARFRRWYGNQAKLDANAEKSPQEIQKDFPAFNELTSELLAVNRNLKKYKKLMYELASSK